MAKRAPSAAAASGSAVKRRVAAAPRGAGAKAAAKAGGTLYEAAKSGASMQSVVVEWIARFEVGECGARVGRTGAR